MNPATVGELFAGIDVGTTNMKVGLFDGHGRRVTGVQRPTPSDPSSLRAEVLRSLATCVESTTRPVTAVGVAGMAETGAPLAVDGTPLTPLISWTDPRGADEAELVNREFGLVPLYASTGRWATAKSPLATWLWLRRNTPAVLDAMACWAGAADLAVQALTAVVRTHPTLAARTVAYSGLRQEYDPDLLAVAGLRPDQLASVTAFDGLAGRVDARAATATGLREGTPVVAAGHDHAVGAWAAGVRRPGQGCVSLGTAEALVLPVEDPPDPSEAMAKGFTTDFSTDGHCRQLVGGLPTSGALVDWLLDTLTGPGEPDRYARLRLLLEAAGPLPTGIIVMPYLRGRVAPAPDPQARCVIRDVTERHGPGDLLAAAIEGTCLHTRWMIAEAAALTGIDVRGLVFMGGQARIPLWMRIKGAVSTVPTTVVASADAVCAGAALFAAHCLDGGADAPILDTDPLPGEPVLANSYTEVYQQFLTILTADVDNDRIGARR